MDRERKMMVCPSSSKPRADGFLPRSRSRSFNVTTYETFKSNQIIDEDEEMGNDDSIEEDVCSIVSLSFSSIFLLS